MHSYREIHQSQGRIERDSLLMEIGEQGRKIKLKYNPAKKENY